MPPVALPSRPLKLWYAVAAMALIGLCAFGANVAQAADDCGPVRLCDISQGPSPAATDGCGSDGFCCDGEFCGCGSDGTCCEGDCCEGDCCDDVDGGSDGGREECVCESDGEECCDPQNDDCPITEPTQNPTIAPGIDPTPIIKNFHRSNNEADHGSDDEDDDDSTTPTPRPRTVGGVPGVVIPTPTSTTEPTDGEDPSETENTTTPTGRETVKTPTDTPSGPSAPANPAIAVMIVTAIIGGALGRNGGLASQAALMADRDDDRGAQEIASSDEIGWGDHSFTWRFPGHAGLDAASSTIPVFFARFSPLLGRLTDDGSEFRAMFGTLWTMVPLAGLALGGLTVAKSGADGLPPTLWILIAGLVLSTFDALAGALAVAVFAIATLVNGSVFDAEKPDAVHSILVILALGFLWMAIPLIGSAIRPFRRMGDPSVRHTWDRVGDFLIAALLCGWVTQKLVQAMDLFAGQPTGLPQHANLVALIAMAAVALRIGSEHFSLAAYPNRLKTVEAADEFPPPLLISSILGAVARTAVFGFIGWSFIGSCWQLWLGVTLFLIPQLIEHIQDSFPTVHAVNRYLPRGLVEIFVLLVACTVAARYAMGQADDPQHGIRLAFLLISIPPALLGSLQLFSDDPQHKPSWVGEFVGAAILGVTAVLAFHGWDY